MPEPSKNFWCHFKDPKLLITLVLLIVSVTGTFVTASIGVKNNTAEIKAVKGEVERRTENVYSVPHLQKSITLVRESQKEMKGDLKDLDSKQEAFLWNSDPLIDKF